MPTNSKDSLTSLLTTLMGAPLLADYFLTNGLEKDAVVVSPDAHGGVCYAEN